MSCHNHGIPWYFLHQSNQHIFGDKVFEIMIVSRYMQEATHCYENFGLEWSFKYSKIIMFGDMC
jgi:hypothetical protein